MTKDQEELLSEASKSLSAAELLYENGYIGYSISRAYYAMFYVAEALLEGEGLSFSKHSAVISAFGEKFAKIGKVPKKFHRFLIEAQELRNIGDYGFSQNITPKMVDRHIERAREFIDVAKSLLER
ncbi:MAG: HEPN domain-containing protein [Candidatus Eremiobacteraeota bacterium]|nr:HEPN domain-containing protein [Candidatus Eremiobacteraeota bacterium]